MPFNRKIILIAFIAFWSTLVFGSSDNKDSLRYEILLSSRTLTDMNVNDSLINSLDITSKRLVLLSTPNQYYLLGWGGMVPINKRENGNISSFAFTTDSALLTIRNNELCYFDSMGNLTRLYKLPDAGMAISKGKNGMYVYDRNNNKQKKALYVIAEGGRYSKLFDVPSAINSVVEIDNSILFATGNAVFSFDLNTKKLKALATLPNNKEIRSLAIDDLSNRIYFSTDSVVYALKDSAGVIITDQFGGNLKCFNNGLLIFNPKNKYLIRISGIENAITSNVGNASNVLSNATVIDLVKSKLSDDLIINIISNSNVNFDLSVDSMIHLSDQNVSSAVIMAMKNAMKVKDLKQSNDE